MNGPPRFVERYLEIPYRRRGRCERGADCFGLVWLVLRQECGIVLPDYTWVDPKDRVAFAAEIKVNSVDWIWAPIAVSIAQAFDVVPMSGPEGEHVGIMVSPVYMLHTQAESGPACELLTDPILRHRMVPQGAPIVRRHHTLLLTGAS
jgi:cell wall-associated NlpC family hydrolase